MIGAAVRLAYQALVALPAEKRGSVLCWFCADCYALHEPGEAHRCAQRADSTSANENDLRAEIRQLRSQLAEAQKRGHDLSSTVQAKVGVVEVDVMEAKRELSDVVEAARTRSLRHIEEVRALEVTIAALRGRVQELEALGNHQPGNL